MLGLSSRIVESKGLLYQMEALDKRLYLFCKFLYNQQWQAKGKKHEFDRPQTKRSLASFSFHHFYELFQKVVSFASDKSLINGFKVGDEYLRIHHVLFVDITILFSMHEEEDIEILFKFFRLFETLFKFFRLFEEASGFNVNRHKSKLFGYQLRSWPH